MSNYTKPEREAIARAFDALTYAASMSWHYAPRLSDAVKLERKQAYPGHPSPATWAKAITLKRWLAGFSAQGELPRKLAGWRPGALGAYMLAVLMMDENGADHGPRGEAIRKAAALAPASHCR
jgi:hypothetical protein